MKKCIICGKAAGSSEHIFPAALGGRRTNKGIYCADHNEGFSPLATILADQFRSLNAMLAVRPDHNNEPVSVVVAGPRSQEVRISGTHVSLVSPPATAPISDGETKQIAFASENEAHKWKAAQKAAGYEVSFTETKQQVGYFTDPIPLQLSFGGSDGLRAIGYVALTFFAHHFPIQVRAGGIASFKNYILGDNSCQLVWWEAETTSGKVEINPFRFGHTIEASVSESTQRAVARVTLFSALTFSMILGRVDDPIDETVVTHIDPLAEHPPRDIVNVRYKGASLAVNRPDDLVAYLTEAIERGDGHRRFSRLLGEIVAFNRQRDMEPLLIEFRNAKHLPPDEQRCLIKKTLEKQGQRIFNLMRHVAKHFELAFSSPSSFLTKLRTLVEPDVNSISGLSAPAEIALACAKDALAAELTTKLGSLTLDQLTMLLSGGPGAAVVARAMFQLVDPELVIESETN